RAIDNLGKRSTLENVTLHTPVSRGVTALAAAGIDNDTPGNIARRWIDPEAALFQRECAMNGMERGAERPADRGLRRIEGDRKRPCLLRIQHRRCGGACCHHNCKQAEFYPAHHAQQTPAMPSGLPGMSQKTTFLRR